MSSHFRTGQLTNRLEGPKVVIDALCESLCLIAEEVMDVYIEKADNERHIALPVSRGGLVRAISAFINAYAETEPPKEFLDYKNRRFETDVFMYIQDQQSVTDSSRWVYAASLGVYHLILSTATHQPADAPQYGPSAPLSPLALPQRSASLGLLPPLHPVSRRRSSNQSTYRLQ